MPGAAVAAATVQGLFITLVLITVSNLMFVLFQYGVAQNLGVSTAMDIALQAVGAAAGNMIAIHNVVAAAATVGLLGQEGPTLRRTLLPTLYSVVGLMGLVAIHISRSAIPCYRKRCKKVPDFRTSPYVLRK